MAQPIFWTPETDPGAILLQPGSAPLGSFRLTADDLRVGATASLRDTQLHVVLRGEHFDASLADPDFAGPLAAVVLIDDDTPDRLDMLARLWTTARGRRVPPDQRMTEQRRQRAKQMLRVVDARDAGTTYRAIAEVMFPQHVPDAASWVGSAIRETTIRLARDGVKLVRGGYRLLLRRPRRNR
ncbi:DUF2285 domain-containing protein [Neorhizobium sp. DT-125]|uniref:DUF2285 domain-containing protein n=1 Tax=Neorhizobium sp. DT-125 TaxID=3396163 RepID=UPI003F1D9820